MILNLGGAGRRVISDNGSQLVARDFKEFSRSIADSTAKCARESCRRCGKLERFHQSLKSERIPGTPLNAEDARRLIQRYVDHYNTVRLHSAIGFVRPQDPLAGRQAEIHAACDRKLETARKQRQLRRQQAA